MWSSHTWLGIPSTHICQIRYLKVIWPCKKYSQVAAKPTDSHTVTDISVIGHEHWPSSVQWDTYYIFGIPCCQYENTEERQQCGTKTIFYFLPLNWRQLHKEGNFRKKCNNYAPTSCNDHEVLSLISSSWWHCGLAELNYKREKEWVWIDK